MYLSTEQYSWPVGLAEVTESDHSVHLHSVYTKPVTE